ncbi:hypothetical protein EGW08_002345 [Elysia chlorotica]|uniref:Uncharacterized protein n=1 Tax=Elysia chlorotica TaxID=188477 RepID=A0A3S1I0N4_ELYCH|nr:hypothetical protein EGW08_002345 [Elysia chlorotica]
MMQKDADNAIPFTYGKTSWRIQEVRGIFALMREEYEASKKMIITKRYRDLKRIIEMFTAEAITEKLHYLLSTESEQRHTKAKLGSQDRSKKTAILACKENSNITHRALTVLKNNLINSNEARLSQHCPQSATTGGFYVKPRSLGVPPISSTYPHSSNVTRENNGIADNLGQACSEACGNVNGDNGDDDADDADDGGGEDDGDDGGDDTFVAAKISLNGMKPISVVLSRWLGAETQNWKLRNTICSRQATETPNSPVVSRRLSLERKYRTKYSSPLASPSKPKACDALSVKSADLGDSLSTRSTVCQISNSDMSNKRIWDRLENGGCLEPKEQTRVLSLSPRTDVSSRCTDSMVDNIVLTIAYDHIIKLRDEYSKLNGKNVWCRYKKMKAMIKSCMRVLNSGQ